MDPKMRRNLAGTFVTRNLGLGAWRLSRSAPAPIDVLLQGVEPKAAEALRPPTVGDIDIEWRAHAVLLTMTSAQRRIAIEAHGAIVHESLARLYENLPLAVLDAKARRFWRRVFRLVRIPGGRYLLGIVARRSRDRP
jgi:hypothetical protein